MGIECITLGEVVTQSTVLESASNEKQYKRPGDRELFIQANISGFHKDINGKIIVYGLLGREIPGNHWMPIEVDTVNTPDVITSRPTLLPDGTLRGIMFVKVMLDENNWVYIKNSSSSCCLGRYNEKTGKVSKDTRCKCDNEEEWWSYEGTNEKGWWNAVKTKEEAMIRCSLDAPVITFIVNGEDMRRHQGISLEGMTWREAMSLQEEVHTMSSSITNAICGTVDTMLENSLEKDINEQQRFDIK